VKRRRELSLEDKGVISFPCKLLVKSFRNGVREIVTSKGREVKGWKRSGD
jgi:hypothetical protein